MQAFGTGILSDSTITLYDASEQARRCFLYALCTGHYFCDTSYIVERSSFNSYLIIYVRKGKLFYSSNSGRKTIRDHCFAVIDCNKPHTYGCLEESELFWVHFDGQIANELCNIILSQEDPRPVHFDRCVGSISEMSNTADKKGPISEPEMNRLLTELLMEFLIERRELRPAGNTEMIENVRAYIAEHPMEDLSIPALASRANLSEYHFLRVFKQQVGMTPHRYLLNIRLNTAEFYLISSDYSIKEIAYHCGFATESAFCTSFKKRRGITPLEYRRFRSLQ